MSSNEQNISSGTSAAQSPRPRRIGELIAEHDLLVIGEHTFPAADCPTLVGEVIRSLRWTVLTTDPEPTVIVMPTLPVKAAPACACGVASEYELDGVYVCRSHFEEARAVGRG